MTALVYVPVSMCTWVLSEFVCVCILRYVPVSVQLFARVCLCVCVCVCCDCVCMCVCQKGGL